MRAFSFFVLSFLLSMVFPLGSMQAHGTGESVEKVVGEYLIDIGYSLPELKAGAPVYFDFNILFNKTQENVAFTDIWVQIAKSSETFFASGISKARFGGTTMAYTFPTGGEYELKVRFQNEGETVEETSFPFQVAAGNAQLSKTSLFSPALFLGVFGGLLIGFFLSIFVKKKA